jgi:hypothetical protein
VVSLTSSSGGYINGRNSANLILPRPEFPTPCHDLFVFNCLSLEVASSFDDISGIVDF